MTNATPRRPNHPDDWPVCGAATVNIRREAGGGMTVWFPAPDCRGEFFAQCRENFEEAVWEDLPPGELRWDVATQRNLWVFADPWIENNRQRFYRVLVAP